MQNQDSTKKFPFALLLKSSFSVMLKNYDKILFLFIIFTLTHSFSFFINNLFFNDAKNLDHNLLSYKIKYYSFNTFISYLIYIIGFSFIRVIDGGHKIWQSLFYVFRKTIPLLCTYLMVSGLFVIVAGEIYVATTITNIANISSGAKIIFYLIIAIVTAFAIITSTRFLWFCSYVAILEEKYYFAAMKQSFSDSKGHILEIFLRNIFVIFVIFIPFTIASIVLTNNPPSFNIEDIELKHRILNDIIFYFPQQFLVIVNYLLYKFYKSHLPKQHAVQRRDKATLLLIVLLPLVIITLVIVAAS